MLNLFSGSATVLRIPFGHKAFLGSNSDFLRSEIYVAFFIAFKRQLLTKFQNLPSSLISLKSEENIFVCHRKYHLGKKVNEMMCSRLKISRI